MDSHLLIITESEQRPPLNKDHPALIAKQLASMVKHVYNCVLCIVYIYVVTCKYAGPAEAKSRCSGHPHEQKYFIIGGCTSQIVCEAHLACEACSFQGGLGACLPRKILKNRCSAIISESILAEFSCYNVFRCIHIIVITSNENFYYYVCLFTIMLYISII